MSRYRHAAGTTLIEILVVIVVFAVGILAVIQVFPKGFQSLRVVRDSTVATQLGRDEIERLKARPDQLPEQILPVRNLNGVVIADDSRDPNDLGPSGDTLAQDGTLNLGGVAVGQWQFNTGANAFRRVIGEGRRVPAATQVGSQFGGLMVVQFGPIVRQTVDQLNGVISPVAAYGNDLLRRTGLPADDQVRQDEEYFVTDDQSASIALHLPSGPTARRYRVVFSGYVQNTPNPIKRDFVGLGAVEVPAATANAYGNYPLYNLSLSSLISDRAGATLVGAEFDSIRVARQFGPIDSTANFSTTEPYEYKVLDPSLGVLLFNPLAADVTVGSASGSRTPLQARIDYDVYDWRVIRDEFRVADGLVPQHRLALGGLRVSGTPGADGINDEGLVLESTTTAALKAISDPKSSHFVLMDLTTGGIVAELSARRGNKRLLNVDKSLGLVTFFDADADASNGLTGEVLYPGNTVTTDVRLAGRPLRALYMANGEWSVQILKAASTYTVSYLSPGAGQYYLGGTGATPRGLTSRIYFPQSDANRKVTIDTVYYTSSGSEQELHGQDFIIRYNKPDTVGLPSIDIRDAAPGATAFSLTNGFAVQGVKGASIAVRVLHNPEKFSLSSDTAANLRRLEQWGRNWKKNTTETYLQRGEIVR